ncbi:chemotaxis protein CheC [Thermococcus indicus]|uniref:Chemotaxis protein CheC n=1 Tax=Thermococcus indicus TaxID=2586643 RepID=A0A4Y5SM83_9EURY|nr:chemotaxis protein CheC [Thermococcus indicus]QDA31885.1 chemotaxis protein CheC [Thermococcus indicus]
MDSENYEEYIKNLDEFAKSALVETFNIGASRAADALSEMTGLTVNITVPEIEITSIKNVPEKVGEDVKVAVYIGLSGGFDGHAFFFLDFEDALKMFDMMMGMPPGSTAEFDEMVQSAVMEAGNILISAFANALSEFLGTSINQTPPDMAVDFTPAILDFALADIGRHCDYTMLLKTTIHMEGVQFREHFMILPHPASMKRIIETLLGGFA